MRKLFSILAVTMMLTTSLCAQEISLKINNQVIETEVEPIQEEGTTLVPIRVITEYLGAEINWEQETQTVTIIKDNQTIELTIGSKVVKVNGVEETLQCAPKLIGATTMVPIRLVSENLGGMVEWEQETGTVVIQTKQVDADDIDKMDDTSDANDIDKTDDTSDANDIDKTDDTSDENDIDKTDNTSDTDEEILKGELRYSDRTYTGEFILIDGVYTPHGQGKLVINNKDNGQIQEGTFENGELVDGKITFASGTYEEGSFKNRQIIKGKIVFAEGGSAEGIFENDKLVNGKKVWADGYYEEGIFENNKLVKGEKVWPSGYSEEGTFKEEKLVNGKKIYAEGASEEGIFKEGKLVEGKKVWVDGYYEEGIFENGELLEGKIVSEDGLVIQDGFFTEEGLYQGMLTIFCVDEDLKAITYLKEGICGDTYIYDLEENLVETMPYEDFLKMLQ